MYTGKQHKEPTSRVIRQPEERSLQQFRLTDNRESVHPLNSHSFARTPKSVLQRHILQNEKQLFYSDKDPSQLFNTHKEAALYEAHLLVKRKPTLYTYTHTEAKQQINSIGIPQGPHFMGDAAVNTAFGVAMQEQDLQTIFNEQCPPPDDWRKLVDQQGPFDGILEPRIEKAHKDYKMIYDQAEKAISSEDSNMASFNIQRLMQLHPTATFLWNTTRKASLAARKNKNENRNISDDINIDTTAVARDSYNAEDFIYNRRQLIDGDYRPLKYRKWTFAEDNKLSDAVKKFGENNWQAVADYVGNERRKSECSQRWSRCLNPKINKGAWTEEEDKKLTECVQEFGDKAWTKVAQEMGNRSDVQCRYHYKLLPRLRLRVEEL